MATAQVSETLVPTNDFVLMEELPPEPYHVYKEYSHVVVPTAFEHGPEDRPLLGKILGKGDSCVKQSIMVGTVALIGKWSGARFQRKGKHYLLVKESDILGIFS